MENKKEATWGQVIHAFFILMVNVAIVFGIYDLGKSFGLTIHQIACFIVIYSGSVLVIEDKVEGIIKGDK